MKLGYRWEAQSRLSLDIATFFNVYNNIQSFEREDPGWSSRGRWSTCKYRFSFDNMVFGETFGLEATANWQ